ncbi:hypothetical protein CJI97_000937 [Candidozyma auris]|nr:hypothetical protein CJI97_000937 [[Candida] auris]
MKLPSVLVLLLPLSSALVAGEFGSYRNPNPRPLHKCDNTDMAMLAQCSNSVLAQLDDCKANDLACECCALQSMDSKCHRLCPGNPSANFLTVLVTDCAPLNDINACNLPFKKTDGDMRPMKMASKEPEITISVKSHLQDKSASRKQSGQPGSTLYSAYEDSDSDSDDSDSDEAVAPEPLLPTADEMLRPVVSPVENHTNVTVMSGASSASFTAHFTSVMGTVAIMWASSVFFIT